MFLKMWFLDYGASSRRPEQYPEDQLQGTQEPPQAIITITWP